MFKRIVAVLVFALLSSALLAEGGMNGKFGIELRGGATLLNPSAFDEDYKNIVLTDTDFGTFNGFPNTDPGASGFIGMAPTGSLLLEYLATPNVGIFFRTDFLTTEDDVTFTDLNDEELFYNHAAFNIGYFGLGGRYYIPASEKFFISIGADAGMFMNYQSFWEVNYLHNEETPSAEERYAVVDFTNMFFGANIEAGAKFMVSDIVGLGANVGYRIASMPIAYPEGDTLDYPFDNVDGSGEKIFKATAIDLSGVYFGAGLSFYFGGTEGAASTTSATGTKSTAVTGASSKYEKWGDYYYKQKNYKGALKYYGGAVKQAPNAGLYKKIGMCYYYMGDKARAAQYLKYYIRQNPSDTQIQNWLKKNAQ